MDYEEDNYSTDSSEARERGKNRDKRETWNYHNKLFTFLY